MKDYDPGFAQQVRPGDVLVGGVNFGYGHPHYPPLRAMRHLGIRALIAESFSPGFWRGEISMGFPMVACPGILTVAKRWESLTIDWARQQVVLGSGTVLPFLPLASADLSMLEYSGLTGYLKHRAAASATP
jgi:3-isopropylmalate/(R)-2-methylmalate dehydratase small subunit